MDYKPSTDNVKSMPEKYHFSVGYVDGCYGSWSITMPTGKVNIDGHLYLAVPNGWEDRLVYYPWYCGHIYWDSNQYEVPGNGAVSDNTHPSPTSTGAQWNDVYYKYYHGNENNLIPEVKKNQFPYRLLLDFGEYVNDTNIFPAYIHQSNKQNILLEMDIRVNGNNSVVNFLFGVAKSEIAIDVDFGDGQSGKLLYNSLLSHTYNNGTYRVKFSIVNGYADLDSKLIVRESNVVPAYSSVDIVDYPLVYETNQGSLTTTTLRKLYINKQYAKACEDLRVLSYCGNVSEVQYFHVYSTEYEYLKLNDALIGNLYIYSCSGDYFKVLFSNSVSIGNIYIASNIHTVDFSCGNTTQILVSNSTNIYLYSSNPVNIVVKMVESGFAYNSDGKDISLGSNVTVYVQSSIISVMQDKYPNINFAII